MIGAQSARGPAQPAAADLMRHVYGDGRGLVAIFTGRRIGDRLEGRQTQFYEYPDELDAATSWALAESGRGREAYFCAHLLTDRRRVKENAAEVLALWGDLDGAEIPNGDLSPTAVVESSPGRYHAYWRLDEPVAPELAERLNQRLARKIGADASGFDLSQVLRVPGTVNHKRERPHAVELRAVSEAAPYAPADLDALLPELPAAEPRPRADGFGEPPVRLAGRAREVWNGDHPKIREGRIDRNASLLKIGRVVYDAGAERPVIVEALRERDDALYRKFTNRADADTRYHEMVDELERNGRRESKPATLTAVPTKPGETGGSPLGERFNPTDTGNARRLIHRHGGRLRHCWPWGRWLVFDGRRWVVDDSGEVYRLAKETVAAIYAEAAAAAGDEERKALAKHAMRSEGERSIAAMVSLARSEPGVPVGPDELDADPWLLNCENGTVDLRAGELHEHRREDLITKLAPVGYDPAATAPTWESFLERVQPDEEMRAFLQRADGYSATGDTSEQAMLIHHGPGANGKSTHQETVSEALGDYAMRTPTETLLAKRSGGVPNDVARLKGARFVAASETEEGRRLAESLIKDLTGQDTISARFMRAEWFDFKPTHKLHLSTNHKPEIRGTDNAIWRRIRLVPWSVSIPPAEQDRKLPEKLRAELPGVLAWIVRGCLEWRRAGLRPPDQVRRATGDYRAEMDVLAAFLDDCCVQGPAVSAFAGELWEAWRRWCEQTGEQAGTQKRFGGRLAERGLESVRDSRTNRKMWAGVGLHVEWEARAELSPNHPSTRFAGNSDTTEPSEPKNNISGSKNSHEGFMRNKGSDGSDGSGEAAGDGRSRA